MSDVEVLNTHRTQGGTLRYCRHDSASTGTPMKFSVLVPDGEGPVPVRSSGCRA